MQISTLSFATRFKSDIQRMTSQFEDLTRQLVSGKKTDRFSGLGTDRTLVLSLRAQVSQTSSFISTIDRTELRIKAMSDSLTRVDEMANKSKTDSLQSSFELLSSGQTQLQMVSGANLDELVSLLNLELDDRYMFSGSATQTKPVELPDTILNGTVTQAGLKQIIDERLQADLGADGRGRLTVTQPNTNEVEIAEEASPNAFGLKLTATSSELTGTTVPQPAGTPPSFTVSFSGTLPNPGEQISMEFALPDGSSETMTLTATSADPPGEGEFTIGADADATAANFQAAFDTALQEMNQTELRAASAVEAGNNFFDYGGGTAPQRVDGPPFDTATGLVDGTETNTVFWYKGDDSAGNPRDSAVARIGDGQTVSYGARADEAPIRDVFKTQAIYAAMEYSEADPNASESYAALTKRIGSKLAFENEPSVASVVTELGLTHHMLDNTKTRYETSKSLSLGLTEDIEDADPYEVGAKIGQLETIINASYQVTAKMNQMTLLNYIR
ncbi:flagellin [Tepidicaulis sp. LMO-SS28]|uniref:flagellin n=1 Tax=Tepidicaulis sp. LMO-SS28 TaxID=3447455 RepID=UPI003EE3DDEA